MQSLGTYWIAIVLVLEIVWSASAFSAQITATSCTRSAVQGAISSAHSGDTVLVPTCLSTVWADTVNVSGKRLKIQGAGVNETNIVVSAKGPALSIDASAKNFVDVSGFTFTSGSGHASEIGMLSVQGALFNVAFRLHDLRLAVGAFGSRGIETEGVYGLIDHVIFDVTNTGSVQMMSPTGCSIGNDGGYTCWNQPLTLGTDKAVYVEDSVFNYSSAPEDSIDAYSGARVVVRHNAFNNATIGIHGTDSGNIRSAFSIEVYDNVFNNSTGRHLRAGGMRGGTGVWFNNRYNVIGAGSAYDGITLMIYRVCQGNQSKWQQCDGTQWQVGSKAFSSDGSRTVVKHTSLIDSAHAGFCSTKRDTVCSSEADCRGVRGGTCSTFFDGSGKGGYPCRDQVGRTHNQLLSPVYAWNNSGGVQLGTWDGGNPNACNGGGLSNYLQPGRDFVNGTSMPGYAPYTYPHPLQNPAR